MSGILVVSRGIPWEQIRQHPMVSEVPDRGGCPCFMVSFKKGNGEKKKRKKGGTKNGRERRREKEGGRRRKGEEREGRPSLFMCMYTDDNIVCFAPRVMCSGDAADLGGAGIADRWARGSLQQCQSAALVPGDRVLPVRCCRLSSFPRASRSPSLSCPSS